MEFKKLESSTQTTRQSEVSVIIPVRNMADKIEKCLEATLAQSLEPHEVIVVDGHSDDGTVEKLGRYPIKIFYEDYHTRAGACQVGIENAEGKYVAFTDGDCIPEIHWLANLHKEFNDSIAGVGGKYEDIGNGLWTRSINFTFKTLLSGAKSRWSERRVAKELSVCGANGMCRREDIQKVGGVNVTLSGAEDLELSNRLSKIGALVYTPDAIVFHDHRRGFRDFARQAYRYGGWRRESHLWDLRVVPPLVAPLLLLSLIFSPWPLIGAVAIYAAAVATMGITIAIQEQNFVYIGSIPVAYIVQHLFYIIGFWKEIVLPRKRKHVATKRK